MSGGVLAMAIIGIGTTVVLVLLVVWKLVSLFERVSCLEKSCDNEWNNARDEANRVSDNRRKIGDLEEKAKSYRELFTIHGEQRNHLRRDFEEQTRAFYEDIKDETRKVARLDEKVNLLAKEFKNLNEALTKELES